MDHSPFGRTATDMIDFRGYAAHRSLVKGVFANGLDLSFVDFSGSWLEGNRLEDCLFVGTDFEDVSDHGNMFVNCVFNRCKFNLAVLGYKGSKYRNCTFRECDFQGSSFVRPEFTDTDFLSCRLKGVDFNASSFENCKFEGLLEEVWFRGTFPTELQVQEFGQPRINKMVDVSFENAELVDLTFSDGCDLSSVKLEKGETYLRFDMWNKRLVFLASEVEAWPDERQRRTAESFIKVYSVHAARQEWEILNMDDLKRFYGIEVAPMIVETLNRMPGTI